ncbi:hypothetical protein B0H16DRAFT_808218 [Mycena metata]|uniref:Uncharacterized protein n=1 Tax=Mycena metata TaxID=1033252 RepID=A0AAD7K6I5_9AGAR|nr:hypothetical protein B0H16DRAFT_808218 [Mycena metata]
MSAAFYRLTMRYIFAMLLACSNLQIALASLYPTRPTATSVFSPGTQNLRWIDTKHRPHVAELGPLTIDLCTRNGTPIANLASRVDASSFNHNVLIPSNLSLPGPFVITFLSQSPHVKFYTADFTIAGSDDTTVTDTTLPYIPQLADTDNGTLTDLVFVLPATTVTTQITPTTKFGAATTVSAGPTGGGAGTGLNQVHLPSSANRKGSKSRRAKYRMAFVLWPALVGVSMAW